MKKPDWEAIRREYETDGTTSARKLADKHGVSHTAINQRAKAEGWKKPAKVSTEKVSKLSRVDNKKMETRKVETGETKPPKKTPTKIGKQSPAIPMQETEFQFEPSDYGLSDQQALFVYWYVKTKNRVEAYRKADYKCEGNTAYAAASRLYRNVKVSKAIRALLNRFRERYTADLDEIVDQLVAITRADPNALTQYRRVNCRHCWGENNLYQWRDIQEYDRAAAKAMKDGRSEPEYGGLGFVTNADPNPDCPRCNGEGEGELLIGDTRDLDANEHAYFLGVKQTKNGIEVLTEDKKSARQMLIQLMQPKGGKAAAESNEGGEPQIIINLVNSPDGD